MHVRPVHALLVMVIAAGCTSALHEPPPVGDLAGRSHVAGGEDEPFEAAEAALARRPDPAAVGEARSLFLQAMADDDAPVGAFLGAARATAWLVEHEADRDRRQELATSGVQIGQWCQRRFPDQPECRYRLALAVGQQARERPSTAVDGLKVMVGLLQGLVDDAPELDSAGPDRVLAMVLLRAPGWPSGPGDPELGLEHARAAAGREPDYPPNQLVLGEALRDNGRPAEGRRALERAVTLAEELTAQGDIDSAEWVAEARKALNGRG